MSNRFGNIGKAAEENERRQRALYPDHDLPEEPDACDLADQAYKDMMEIDGDKQT